MKKRIILRIWNFVYGLAKFTKLDREWYIFSSKVLYKFCFSDVIKYFFERDFKATQLFLNNTGFSRVDAKIVLRKALFITCLKYLWGKQLDKVAPIQVDGAENLQAAKFSKRGIMILRSHQRINKLLTRWLHKNIDISLAIGQSRKTMKWKKTNFSDTEIKLAFTQDLLNAKKILLLGGNVEIAPDGYFGTKMLTYELFGKARGFSIGFAELASSTNSCVLPVGIDVNEQGIITINIWPLLQANKEDTEQGNLTFLVDYYVNYLRKCWNNSPHMITHGHMLKFIKANEGI